MKLMTLFILGWCLSFVQAAEFKIDSTHSHVGFKVRYMMLSSIRGHFKKFNGKVHFDKNGELIQISGSIDVDSIETLNKKRDQHLKSDSFFNVDLYPEIKFNSLKIIKEDSGFIALGNLEIHGISKKVTIPFNLSDKIIDGDGNERVGIVGAIRINRKKYGIMYSEKMDNGGHIVDDHVDLELNVQLIKTPS